LAKKSLQGADKNSSTLLNGAHHPAEYKSVQIGIPSTSRRVPFTGFDPVKRDTRLEFDEKQLPKSFTETWLTQPSPGILANSHSRVKSPTREFCRALIQGRLSTGCASLKLLATDQQKYSHPDSWLLTQSQLSQCILYKRTHL
jgi:hypothetical protein